MSKYIYIIDFIQFNFFSHTIQEKHNSKIILFKQHRLVNVQHKVCIIYYIIIVIYYCSNKYLLKSIKQFKRKNVHFPLKLLDSLFHSKLYLNIKYNFLYY